MYCVAYTPVAPRSSALGARGELQRDVAPSELPTTCAVSKPASSIARSTASGMGVADLTFEGRPARVAEQRPASISRWRSSAGSTSSQVRQVAVKPRRPTSGGPELPRCDGANMA